MGSSVVTPDLAIYYACQMRLHMIPRVEGLVLKSPPGSLSSLRSGKPDLTLTDQDLETASRTGASVSEVPTVRGNRSKRNPFKITATVLPSWPNTARGRGK